MLKLLTLISLKHHEFPVSKAGSHQLKKKRADDGRPGREADSEGPRSRDSAELLLINGKLSVFKGKSTQSRLKQKSWQFSVTRSSRGETKHGKKKFFLRIT